MAGPTPSSCGRYAAFSCEARLRAKTVNRHLGISQPAFSRLVGGAGDEILTVGRARATRYLASRSIADVGRVIPIYEIDETAGSRQLARLHPVGVQSYWFEALQDDGASGHHEDLPHFLYDLRPSGFLGRLIPRRHPEIGLPADVTLWTADQSLQYLTRYGWDLPGNLILGDAAFARYLATGQPTTGTGPADRGSQRSVGQSPASAPDSASRTSAPASSGASAPANPRARVQLYAELADDVLSAGPAGSSAGGEQPKFLATRALDAHPVLVKFSPPTTDAFGQRTADLLIAEHFALEVMRSYGHDAATSELLIGADRTFLEVQRFDRLPGGGRRGVMSLFPFDAHHLGGSFDWLVAGAGLAAAGILDESLLPEIRWRHAFGRLIANTDMHAGNLSFFTRGTRVIGLAPAYDMGPSLYAPVMGNVRDPAFPSPLPHAQDGGVWATAADAAREFWERVADAPEVSAPFRHRAAENAGLAAAAKTLAKRLPS